MSGRKILKPHCVFPTKLPSSVGLRLRSTKLQGLTILFTAAFALAKKPILTLLQIKKMRQNAWFFLWRFGFALLIVVMPFGFVLFVTTHLSLQYENSIQTKFEVFVCYLPEVLNVQTDIFFCFLLFILRFFFEWTLCYFGIDIFSGWLFFPKTHERFRFQMLYENNKTIVHIIQSF